MPESSGTIGRFLKREEYGSKSLLKLILLSTAPAILVGGLATSAWSQENSTETVEVTGTRIQRDGYQSPTPLTVVNADAIAAQAPTNVADYLDKLPSLANSSSARTTSTSVSDGNGGVSNLNLRRLGANRTLVLLDGMRIVPSSVSGFNSNGGAVDTNSIPDSLISRIDVVTGGASAAYGSDALAGVVNFVLDKNYSGLKGSVVGGISDYGDDDQYSLSLTGGTGFLDDRGHLLLSGQYNHVDGILHGNARPWLRNGWDQISNPAYTSTNGLPFYLVTQQVGSGLFTPGGLITSGPLRGLDFGPNGSTRKFNYGTLNAGAVNMVGGDWLETVGALTDNSEGDIASLDDKISRQNLFARVSYDITDNIEAFGQFSYSETNVFSYCCWSSESFTIKSGNPFIPAAVQSQMTALNIPSFVMGKWNTDIEAAGVSNRRGLRHYIGGLNGKFEALGSTWTWNAFANRSISTAYLQAINNPIKAQAQLAGDVVRDPGTGSPICASTLANPGNGCIPYNPMGTGMNTPAAINYAVGGRGYLNQTLTQDEFSGSINGEPFSSWAGPVSLAVGVEYRTLGVTGKSSTLDQANAFFLGNFHPTIGSYHVTEGFVETVVPLAKDMSWAKELDVNLAFRETNYSTSGYVSTFKAGATYDTPVNGLRFRGTLSRDIRAPNLGELYAGGQSGQGSIIDATKPGSPNVPNILTLTVGNTQLKPEVANTVGAGVVYQPDWFPGFSTSVDYYSIRMNHVIGSVSAQNEVYACAQGVSAYCGFIERDGAGNISQVTVKPANTAFGRTAGVDIEASYNTPLSTFADKWPGAITLRALGSNMWDQTNIDALGNVTKYPGPDWRYFLTADYDTEMFNVQWTGRGFGSGIRNRNYTQCTSGCPALTAPFFAINDNILPGAFYMDVAFTYHMKSELLGRTDLSLSIENLENKDPPNTFVGTGGNYDRLGRLYRLALRFNTN